MGSSRYPVIAIKSNRFSKNVIAASVKDYEVVPIFIHDITALAGLTNLTELRLSGCNNIYDVTPLASLTNLRKLSLDKCGGRGFFDCNVNTLRKSLKHCEIRTH